MKLLEHFHEISLHPASAKELKSLILQLAVQGKLTAKWREENPDVEPASDLLERIKDEKGKLVKEGKFKKEKFEFSINESKIPFILPQNWEWCHLENINYDIHYGYTASAKDSFGNIGLLRITDIQENKVNWNTVPDCDISEKEFRKHELKENDILIARTGGTIGKTYQVKNISVKSVFASYLIRAIPVNRIHAEYEKLFLESPFYWKQLKENSQGTGQPNVNATSLKSLLVPLPPLEEQKAIVQVVEQLFNEVEQLEQLTKHRIQLKESYAASALNELTKNDTIVEWTNLAPHFKEFFDHKPNIKKLRETILQLAVQGKLTHHWRKDNPDVGPAFKLLERINAEKEQLVKEGKIKKEKPLLPIAEDEIPYELPGGWVWCRFQEIFDIRDGTHDSPKAFNGKISYPLVTSKDFKNGIIDFSEAKKISEADYEEINKRSKVNENDILFSMIGGNIGNQVMVKGVTSFAIKNVALFKYYSQSLTLPFYLKVYSENIAFTLQKKAIGGAQPFVSLTYLRNMLFPLSPLQEQKAIVEIVNGLMQLCDQLETQVQQGNEQIEKLMQSCLKEVFLSARVLTKDGREESKEEVLDLAAESEEYFNKA